MTVVFLMLNCPRVSVVCFRWFQYFVSCLTWAAGRGYTEIVEALLIHGAKVNTADKVTDELCETLRCTVVAIVQILCYQI